MLQVLSVGALVQLNGLVVCAVAVKNSLHLSAEGAVCLREDDNAFVVGDTLDVLGRWAFGVVGLVGRTRKQSTHDWFDVVCSFLCSRNGIRKGCFNIQTSSCEWKVFSQTLTLRYHGRKKE